MLHYIKYFFYLAWHWNISIAWYLIKEEIKGEKKFGIRTTGADELQRLEKKGIDITHSTMYMGASYGLLEDLFIQIPPASIHHFIDIGCGKGRTLCVAAALGCKKLSGIDFSREFCEAAKENLSIIKQAHSGFTFTIINNDAFYFDIPDDADCIFLFNPFDDIILSGVAEHIHSSLEEHPRSMYIAYANPLYKSIFFQYGFKEIYHRQKMKYMELSILFYEKASL